MGGAIERALKSGKVKVPGMQLQKKASYFIWEKSAFDEAQPSAYEEPTPDNMMTSPVPPPDEEMGSTPPEEGMQQEQQLQPGQQPEMQGTAPLEAELQKMKLEEGEQSLRHNEETHEQKMRHAEELHALKMQQVPASGGSKQQQQIPPPMHPVQAQAMARTNLLSNYVQSQMPKQASFRLLAKIAKELIEGGEADGEPDSKYPESEIARGIKVEHEHTDDPAKAKEIAKDHLEESPRYYQELAKMEAKLDKESSWQQLKKEAAEHIRRIRG